MSEFKIAPDAFILLTLPNATLTTPTASESGSLSLECVTFPTPSDAPNRNLGTERDVYLVVRLNSIETPIDPTQAISSDFSQDSVYTYNFSAPNQERLSLNVALPSNKDPFIMEDLETFNGILSQYADTSSNSSAALGDPQSRKIDDEDLRGHLVLVNEETGAVIGEFDQPFFIREDPALGLEGHESGPVVIEVDRDGPLEVFARAIPEDQQDWVTRGAKVIRCVE